MPWYYLVRDSDGALVADTGLGPVAVPPGHRVITLPERADLDALAWDTAGRGFVPRPAPVMVDRIDDLLTEAAYADFRTVWNSLSAQNRTRLRDALARWLGPRRYREVGEAVTLE